jgi:hypothetical protein
MQVLSNTNKLFLVILSCVGLGTLALQTPAIIEHKNSTHDYQVSSDLQSLKSAISEKNIRDSKLPAKLSDLDVPPDLKARISQYEYNIRLNDYELCGVFKTSTPQPKAQNTQANQFDDSTSTSYVDFFNHQAGRVCFKQSTSAYDSYDNFYDQPLSTSTNSGISSLSGIQTKARDTEIQTDVNNIHSKLEEYFNNTATYPTLSQLKDASWRKTNMPGIDDESFKGPNGETVGSGYNYTATPSGCQNTTEKSCDGYTLSAKLSTGLNYTKYSLN